MNKTLGHCLHWASHTGFCVHIKYRPVLCSHRMEHLHYHSSTLTDYYLRGILNLEMSFGKGILHFKTRPD